MGKKEALKSLIASTCEVNLLHLHAQRMRTLSLSIRLGPNVSLLRADVLLTQPIRLSELPSTIQHEIASNLPSKLADDGFKDTPGLIKASHKTRNVAEEGQEACWTP